MGCSAAKPASENGGETSSVKSFASSGSAKENSHKIGTLSAVIPDHAKSRSIYTENKVNQALKKKKEENELLRYHISFEKILLKFEKLRIVLGYVRTVFNEIATNGFLDHNGLQTAMKRLDVHMSMEEILELFDFIDLSATHKISLKEFFVALTVGVVLDAIPILGSVKPSVPQHLPKSSAPPPIKRSFSTLLGHQNEVGEMLNLVVSAYLIFDPEGKGYIEKIQVERMMEEHGHKQGSNAMLSQQRWSEMVRNFALLNYFHPVHKIILSSCFVIILGLGRKWIY